MEGLKDKDIKVPSIKADKILHVVLSKPEVLRLLLAAKLLKILLSRKGRKRRGKAFQGKSREKIKLRCPALRWQDTQLSGDTTRSRPRAFTWLTSGSSPLGCCL
jgi:hypothetical protein